MSKEENGVLLNLRIISEIKRGDKLITGSDILEIDSRFFQSFHRYFDGDGRRETVNKLAEIIQSSFVLTDKILEAESGTSETTPKVFQDNNSNRLQMFKSNMESARKGLDNLRETYDEDITIRESIKQLIKKLDARIGKIQDVLSITH